MKAWMVRSSTVLSKNADSRDGRDGGLAVRRVFIRTSLLLLILFPTMGLSAPDWWTTRHVIATNIPPNDYAPVLRGQLSWLAENAGAELDAKLPGGTDDAIRAGLTNLITGTQDRPVNLGQLKHLLTPFYRRLIEEGVVAAYPWDGFGNLEDYSPVNIGQVKQAFSFQFTGIHFNPSISGMIGYSGGQTGLFRVVATPELGQGLEVSTLRQSPGAYHLVVDHQQTNWAVEGWCDADGDAVRDTWEAAGAYGFNPVLVTGVVSGIDLVLLDPDEDGDGLPGYLEQQWGLDPLWSADGLFDEDGDGLSLAEEWQAGSDPRNGDSDGDGMGDGAEVVNGSSPTNVNSFARLPFVESFELPTVHCGELAGQNGWNAGCSNVAWVATNPAADGAQVLCLRADTNADAVVTHPLATYGNKIVWIDFRAAPVRRMASAVAAPPRDGVGSAFYVNRDGVLLAYDSTFSPGTWVCLSNAPSLEPGVLSRFTVRLDYSAQRWGLWLNATNVLCSLPFATPVPEFSRLLFRSAYYQETLVDSITVATNTPAGFFVDSDADGLPDEWEQRYGFDPYNPSGLSDSDYDGLSNLEEYQLGLSPMNPDCDGDGISDGVERALQLSPTNADVTITATVPFVETFEAPQVSLGDLREQHGWAATVTNWAMVQAHSRSGSLQALCLRATTNEEARVHQIIKGVIGATTWSDLQAIPVQRRKSAWPSLHAASTAAFYINASGQPVAASGTNWVVLTNAPIVACTNWSRFTVMQDFSNQVWSLSLDGRIIAKELGFVHHLTSAAGLRFSGPMYTNAWVDDIRVTTEVPGDIDNDGDGLPNAWELAFGFDPFEPSDLADADQDGLSNLEEYRLGLNPRNPDSDGDGLGDGTEQARGLSATNANAYLAFPFQESFETPGVTNGLLVGQHGWRVLSGISNVVVNTNPAYSGLQALQLGGVTSAVAIYQPLVAAGKSVIWTDLRSKPVFRTVFAPPILEPASTVGFYVNQAGRLVVADSTNWVTLTDAPVLATNAWVRFTICQDFSNRVWDLYLDGWPVANGLGFATGAPREYSGLVVKHGAQRVAVLDDVTVSANRSDLPERFPGSDWSDLEDAADPDNDGLVNSKEYQLGLDPRNPDSDGDGMGDGTEVGHGFDPATSNSFAGLPSHESFERPVVTNGNVAGQHGWQVSGTNYAWVQTNTVFEGGQGLALQGTGAVERAVAALGKRVVWTDFHARPIRRNLDYEPEPSANAALAFYVNVTGQVAVCTAYGWETLTAHHAVSTSQWVRFTVKADYEAQCWGLWLDGVCIGSGLSFANPVQEFSVAKVSAPLVVPGYFDAMSIATNEPAGLDDDGDGLPNVWELAFGFDPAEPTDTLDPDFDGLTNLEEYRLGLDPRNPDSDFDGLVDGHDGVMPIGLYPQGVDRNGDGFADGEADYGCDPLNPDCDGDGMVDGVEVAQGLDPAQSSLGQGLVAWYRLDETNGTVVADSSSNRLDGVWLGGGMLTGAIGRVGSALEFDGLTNGISVAENPLLKLYNIGSYAVWVRPDFGATETTMKVVWQGGGGLQLTNRCPEICLPGFVPSRVLAPVRLVAGEWAHLAATRNGSNLMLYVDGAVVLNTNLTGEAADILALLGIGCEAGTTNSGFDGALDDVRLYNRVLSLGEIQELYTLGADPDGDTKGTQDELISGSDPAQSLMSVGIAGDLDGDGRVTGRDRARLQALVAELGRDVTRFEYDEEGNQTRKTDALGHVSTVAYDGNNRPVTTTDANGHTTRYEVNAVGAVTAVTDPVGGVTRFVFNAFGNVVQVTDPGGNQTRIEYNAAGQEVRTVNTRGVSAVTIYDELGRVQVGIAAEGLPEEQRTWSFYDAADRLVSNRNQLGVAKWYVYDARGLNVKQVLAAGTADEAVEETTYDERGLAVSWKDPRGSVMHKTYDALGRCVTSADALGHLTRTCYDNLGNAVATQQPSGRTLRQEFDKWGRAIRQMDGSDQAVTEYDVLNRVTAQTDWRGIRSERVYDPVGNVIQSIVAKGTTAEAGTCTTYDGANRLVRVGNANGGAVTYAYDVCGNKSVMSNELGNVTRWGYQYGNRLAWTQKPDGVVVSNQYDALDRLSAEIVSNAVSKAFNYDALSRMTNAVDFNDPGTSADDNQVGFAYDARNRVVSEWQNGRWIQRHFDAAGNADQLTGPSGVTVNRVYNENNRLVELRNAAGTLTYASYIYTPNGRVQTVTYASGVVETHGYDARERLSSLRQQGVNYDYSAVLARDPNGNVTVSSESSGEGASYTYDAANRVTVKKALNELGSEALDYDPLGNWLSLSNPVQGRVSRTVNLGNQYTRVGAGVLSYDQNGSLTTRDQAGYVYDYRGRLVEVRSNGVALASYTYDALNRRVSKLVGSVRSVYYYDGEALIDEAVNGAWARSYIFADTIDTPVVFLRSGVPYYYLRDWHANIAAITDAVGHPVEQYRYSLFGQMQFLDGSGNPLSQSGLGNIWTFAARQWDQESGLLHYRNRAYSAELGRFLQQDPAGYADGLNLYAYAGNNPLLFSDPYGLYRWDHGALDSRVGEWIVSQYGQLREIERQRREYEEALRRAEEERRRQQQAANERAARAFSQYQKDHAHEIKDMVGRYKHLGVNEKEATQMLMSGVTSIPRLGASVGSNDARRDWWLDYYLRGGQINEDMRGEMKRMGTSNVDLYFAKTSQKETQLRNKRKAARQQYTLAAVAIVATVVTCGAGGVLGAAMLGTVGMTSAAATSFGAYAAGAVVIQGVSAAATTVISHGNIGDFAQTWAINSAGCVAGYGAGYGVAKMGKDVAMQLAVQSGTSTFVSSGMKTAIDGDGFKNVFRDTAISFAAGGMMGSFISAAGTAKVPTSFGEYMQASNVSTLGYLHSPISSGLRGSLRAAMYGGNMVEAFEDGAVSKEAVLDFAMASVIAPVASYISSSLVAALPADPHPVATPVAKTVVWSEPSPINKAQDSDFVKEKFGVRAVRGSAVTVMNHLQEMVVAPAHSLLEIYKTVTANTWLERSRVLNPFSRSFAGWQVVDGVADAALVAGGLPISFLSGDFLESKWDDRRTSMKGVHAISFNGMANSEADAENMKRTMSGIKGNGVVTQVTNRTHGWGISGDIVQALGNEFGLIDITAIRGANALRDVAANGAGTIDVTAHSQGTMTFRRALDLVDDTAIRSRIQYQGIGSETYISKNYLGLKSADNYWNRSVVGGNASGVDVVPLVNFVPFLGKALGDSSYLLGDTAWHIVQSPHNINEPNGNHHGVQYYAGYIRK